MNAFGRSIAYNGVLALVLASAVLTASCTPTLKLQAPDEPIRIQLDVRIEQEVRMRVERELEDVLRERRDIY